MRNYTIIFILLSLFSCEDVKNNYHLVIADNDKISTDHIRSLDEPGKALLSWYLYAYGNQCKKASSKIKCQILNEMGIEDECRSQHLNNLLKWFSNDMLVVYKLNKCPNLPIDSAIQNTFEKIELIRNVDTLSIRYSINGLNTIQEKSWNISKTDSYLIFNNTFSKILNNE